MDIIEKLRALYADQSKHSVYQNTPQFIRDKLGYTEIIDENWRGDSARWEYLQENFNFNGNSILDIGANTGFFSLNIAHSCSQAAVYALEGNNNHGQYIKTLAEYFNMLNIKVLNQYLCIKDITNLDFYDTVLLFNVLHHAGVDFDTKSVESENGLSDYCTRYLHKLSHKCNRIIFQMGYNWGGNKQHPVVDLNDDSGKIIYTSKLMKDAGLEIKDVALSYSLNINNPIPASLKNIPKKIIQLLNSRDWSNAEREIEKVQDRKLCELSEFYRRPLFTCIKE